MSAYQQIIGLLGQVQSQAELRVIGSELNKRFRQLQPSAQSAGFGPGDSVEFFARGRTIRGTVKKVNVKSVSVAPDDGGPEWRVGPGLLRKAGPKGPKRPEAEVLKEIGDVYCELSPENLTCDGELGHAAVMRKRRALDAKLEGLFVELGRRVSEEEAYGVPA